MSSWHVFVLALTHPTWGCSSWQQHDKWLQPTQPTALQGQHRPDDSGAGHELATTRKPKLLDPKCLPARWVHSNEADDAWDAIMSLLRVTWCCVTGQGALTTVRTHHRASKGGRGAPRSLWPCKNNFCLDQAPRAGRQEGCQPLPCRSTALSGGTRLFKEHQGEAFPSSYLFISAMVLMKARNCCMHGFVWRSAHLFGQQNEN